MSSAEPSQIEREVMKLFEQFRDPLLRYELSFGIPVHDAEEVTQEVFVSLFRHLQLRRSRQNLRGWIFRVAHNLALKKRSANQKSHQATDSGREIAEKQIDPSPGPEEQASNWMPPPANRLVVCVTELIPSSEAVLNWTIQS